MGNWQSPATAARIVRVTLANVAEPGRLQASVNRELLCEAKIWSGRFDVHGIENFGSYL